VADGVTVEVDVGALVRVADKVVLGVGDRETVLVGVRVAEIVLVVDGVRVADGVGVQGPKVASVIAKHTSDCISQGGSFSTLLHICAASGTTFTSAQEYVQPVNGSDVTIH